MKNVLMAAILAVLAGCGGGGGGTTTPSGSLGAGGSSPNGTTPSASVTVPFATEADIVFQPYVSRMQNSVLNKLISADGSLATFANLTQDEKAQFIRGRVLVFDSESMVLVKVTHVGSNSTVEYREAELTEIYKKFKLNVNGSIPKPVVSTQAVTASVKSVGIEKYAKTLNASISLSPTAVVFKGVGGDKCAIPLIDESNPSSWHTVSISCTNDDSEGRESTVSGKIIFNTAPALEDLLFEFGDNVSGDVAGCAVAAYDQVRLKLPYADEKRSASCQSPFKVRGRVKADVTADLQVDLVYSAKRERNIPLYSILVQLPPSAGGAKLNLGLSLVIEANGKVSLNYGLILDNKIDVSVDSDKIPFTVDKSTNRIRSNVTLTVTASITPALQLAAELIAVGQTIKPIDIRGGIRFAGDATASIKIDTAAPSTDPTSLCGSLAVHKYLSISSDLTGIKLKKYQLYESDLKNPLWQSGFSSKVDICGGSTNAPSIELTPEASYNIYADPFTDVVLTAKVKSGLLFELPPTWTQVSGPKVDVVANGSQLRVYTQKATGFESAPLVFQAEVVDSQNRRATDTAVITLIARPSKDVASTAPATSSTSPAVSSTLSEAQIAPPPVVTSVSPSLMFIGVPTDITIEGRNLPGILAVNVVGHLCSNTSKKFSSPSRVVVSCLASASVESTAAVEVKVDSGSAGKLVDTVPRFISIKWTPASLNSISPTDSFRAGTLQTFKAFGQNLYGALSIDNVPGRSCSKPLIISTTEANFNCTFAEAGTSNLTIRHEATGRILLSRSLAVLVPDKFNTQTSTFNIAPVISNLSVAPTIFTGSPISGAFEIQDVNSDMVQNLRVHVSKTEGGSDCQIDVGVFANPQALGVKTFSGCALTADRPGALFVKVEARDVAGAQAVVKGATVMVVSAPASSTSTTTITTAPITVSNFAGGQGAVGQAINGSFSVAGSSVSLLRLHAGTSASDTWCYTDFAPSIGAKSFSFQGAWTNQNGKNCAGLIPTAGTSTSIVFKVEARDNAGLLANAGSPPVVAVNYAAADLSPTVSGHSPSSVTLNQVSTFNYSGSNLVSGMGVTVRNCENTTDLGGNSSTRSFSCVPRTAGAQTLTIKTAPNGTTLYNGAVTVVGPAVPTVSGHSPTFATLNQSSTFYYSGSNLVTGMGVTVTNCDSTVDLGGSNSLRSFSCIPRTAGAQTLTIKTAPSGTTLYNGAVTVVGPAAPTVSSHSPSSVTLNQVSTFNYSGSNLVTGMGVTVTNCDTTTDLGGNSLTRSFSCIPRTVGAQTLTIKTAAGGATLYDGAVTVVGPALPTIAGHSPTFATLNQVSTFNYYGSNLVAGMGFTVTNCDSTIDLGGGSSFRSFSCIPRTAGAQTLTVKTAPGGTTLYTGAVTIIGPPVFSVASFSPASFNVGVNQLFNIGGANVPSTAILAIQDAICQAPFNYTATSFQQRCTAQLVGQKEVVIKNAPGAQGGVSVATYMLTVNP